MKKYLAGLILPVLCFLSPTVANAQVETTLQLPPQGCFIRKKLGRKKPKIIDIFGYHSLSHCRRMIAINSEKIKKHLDQLIFKSSNVNDVVNNPGKVCPPLVKQSGISIGGGKAIISYVNSRASAG